MSTNLNLDHLDNMQIRFSSFHGFRVAAFGLYQRAEDEQLYDLIFDKLDIAPPESFIVLDEIATVVCGTA